MDYLYLRAWGQWLHSNWEYTEHEITVARRENAPQNVIHREVNGRWVTADEIRRKDTRQHIEKIVEKLRKQEEE